MHAEDPTRVKTHVSNTTTQNAEKYVHQELPSMSRIPETDRRQNASRCHFRIQFLFRFAEQIVEQYIKPKSTTQTRNTFQSSSFHAFRLLQLKTRKNTRIRTSQARAGCLRRTGGKRLPEVVFDYKFASDLLIKLSLFILDTLLCTNRGLTTLSV